MEPPMLTDEALETAADSAPAQARERPARGDGARRTLCGVPFGSDASKLSRQGIPSLVFGPGSIDQAHAAVEFVEIGAGRARVRVLPQFHPAFRRSAAHAKNTFSAVLRSIHCLSSAVRKSSRSRISAIEFA